jgi:gamma-carbonic anhydrase
LLLVTDSRLLTIGGHAPKLGARVYIAPTASVIGDVVLGDDVSIWFGCVLRGDVGAIRIGARTNIQDLSLGHMTDGMTSLDVGVDVTVGHGVILHGCSVGDRCLIGMGSILLDGVIVGADSLVAAGSLLPPRMVVPPGSLVRGNPAKVVREATESERAMGPAGAAHYVLNKDRYLAG